MKKGLTSLISIGATVCMLLLSDNAFSQDSTSSAKSKQKILKDKMPVIVPESDDSIPVIHPGSREKMPTVNPDTVRKASPKTIRSTKRKRTYNNNYNYPYRGNHFGDRRIRSMVGQSDTRRTNKARRVDPY
jgi:hypothetical protein